MKKASVRKLFPVLPLAFFCATMMGCGQKGPLYLPQPEKPVPANSKVETEKPALNKPTPDNPKSDVVPRGQ